MAGTRLTVVATIKAKAGMEEKVREELLAMVAPTRKEPGCLNYDLHQAQEDSSLFIFYENWLSRKDLDEHLQTPHFQAFAAKADHLLARPVDITLCEMISPEVKKAG